MNKRLYPWLILFLCLTGASVLLQSIIYSLIGPQLFRLDSFNFWFLTTVGTAVIGSVLLLRYYFDCKYWFAFVTYAFYCVCNLCYLVLFYTVLNFHHLFNSFRPLTFLSVGVGALYGVSLLLLKAVDKRWLRIAGVVMILLQLSSLLPLVWSATQTWTSFTECLLAVPFILHFSGERSRARDVDLRGSKYTSNITGVLGAVSLSMTVLAGVMISAESYSSLYWSTQNHRQTKELAKLCDPGIFVNRKGETLRYRFLKPLDYDSAKKYPIVVSLPYGGQPPTDTIRQIDGAVAALLLTTDENRKKYPAFIFIPNCPPGAGWGGIPNYPAVDSIVFDAIMALDRRFSIDDKRRYVIGLSKGGYGTWNFICKRPEMFAAAIPVAGGGDPKLARRAVTVAVWAFHGALDKNVPVSNSRNMIKAIKAAGGNPEYTEYADQGHNIWENVKATPGLLDWLFAQHRN